MALCSVVFILVFFFVIAPINDVCASQEHLPSIATKKMFMTTKMLPLVGNTKIYISLGYKTSNVSLSG